MLAIAGLVPRTQSNARSPSTIADAQPRACSCLRFRMAATGGQSKRRSWKATGTVAGVPDTIWIKDGQTYALELKAEGGKPTAKQVEAIAAMQVAGAITGVAIGLDDALRWLEERGLLRGQAT